MRVLLMSAVFVGTLGLAAGPAAAQTPLEATFSFASDPGDYIGGGQTRSFTLDTASIASRSGQNGGYFGITVFPFAGGYWYVDIAAPQGSQLVPGSYEGAVRYPFQSPAQPGLSISGDGRGCNTVTGRFDVIEATFGPNGYIERFHATFEQHCEGFGAALFGEVQVANPPPPTPLEISLTLNPSVQLERLSGKVRVTGTVTCTVPASLSFNAVLRQRLSRYVLASSGAGTSTPCSLTPAAWTIDFLPQGGAPFSTGWAQLDLAASGYDGNYNTFVSVAISDAVKIQHSR